ncbi:MAG: RsmE family RNA methyltransferase [Pseudomonadota bacterium]
MKHLFRFFGTKEDSWKVQPSEIEHMIHVLRMDEGDRFEIMDGKGRIASARCLKVTKKTLDFEVEEEIEEPQPTRQLELAVGALRPNTYEEMIPPLVELGLSRLFIFGQDFVNKERLNEKVKDRFHRLAITAAKQCKSAWLPEMIFTETLDETLRLFHCEPICLLPGSKLSLFEVVTANEGSAGFIIGGEKGFSDREELLLSEYRKVTLGPQVLRAWTAAVAATAVFASKYHT